MFRKYEKTFRILVPQFDIHGKFTLSKEETQRLLAGKVTITEKLDGANIGIIRHKDEFRLQKRGSLVDTSEHEQFNFFRDWSFRHHESLMKLPKNTITYGELLRCVHTVYYDRLLDWVYIFGMWSKQHEEYLPYDEVRDMVAPLGLQMVPLLHIGHVFREDLAGFIPGLSVLGSEKAEGIVIVNYRQQIRGKVVRPEFVKDMEESDHWRNQALRFNKLAGE